MWHPVPHSIWGRVDSCPLSRSTQVLALNNACRCKGKWEEEKAANRNTQSGKYAAVQGEKLFCFSSWTSNQCRWSLRVPHSPHRLPTPRPLRSRQRPRESKIKKLLQKWTLRTGNGPETCNKSCKLRHLQGPGGNVRNWNVGATEAVGSGGDCGKPKDTWAAQFLLTMDLQFLESYASLLLFLLFSNEVGCLYFFVTFSSF